MGYRSDIDALSSQKIADAPSDGNEYARKNGSWVQVSTDLQEIFPIGCSYITLTNTNPSITLGFGTWVLRGTGKILTGG